MDLMAFCSGFVFAVAFSKPSLGKFAVSRETTLKRERREVLLERRNGPIRWSPLEAHPMYEGGALQRWKAPPGCFTWSMI